MKLSRIALALGLLLPIVAQAQPSGPPPDIYYPQGAADPAVTTSVLNAAIAAAIAPLLSKAGNLTEIGSLPVTAANLNLGGYPIPYASPLNFDVSQGRMGIVAPLTGNPVMNCPTNMKVGGEYIMYLTQDGVGSRVPTWPACFLWPGKTIGVLSTAANSLDQLLLRSPDGINAVASLTLNYGAVAPSWIPSTPSGLVLAVDTNDPTTTTASGTTLTSAGNIYGGTGVALTPSTFSGTNIISVSTSAGADGAHRVLTYGTSGVLTARGITSGFAALINLWGGDIATKASTYMLAAFLPTGTNSRLALWTKLKPSGLTFNQYNSLRGSTSNFGYTNQNVDGNTAVGQTALSSGTENGAWHVYTLINNLGAISVYVDTTLVASIAGGSFTDFTTANTDFYVGVGGTAGQVVENQPDTPFNPPTQTAGMLVYSTALSGTNLTNAWHWAAVSAGITGF